MFALIILTPYDGVCRTVSILFQNNFSTYYRFVDHLGISVDRILYYFGYKI